LLVKHFCAKEREACTSRQEPLVRVSVVPSPFNWTGTPGRGSSCSNGVIISLTPMDHTDPFFALPFASLFHPSSEEIRLPFPHHPKKRVREARPVADFLSALETLPQPLVCFRWKIVLSFGTHPAQLPRSTCRGDSLWLACWRGQPARDQVSAVGWLFLPR
jgi:hypothetical protein